MTPDWRVLAPHRPVGVGDERYVPRTHGCGDEIARWIESGENSILVAGPTGVGKSSELARALTIVEASNGAVFLPFDHYLNPRTATPEQLYLLTAQLIIEQTKGEKTKQLVRFFGQVATAAVGLAVVGNPERPPFDQVTAAIRAARRQSRQDRVMLFYDGLEKTTPESARVIYEALSTLAPEACLIMTAPWHAIYGPDAHFVVNGYEKVVTIMPLDTETDEGRAFLIEILRRRLQLDHLPDRFLDIANSAARWSGGIPRTFLQLVGDAAARARLTEGVDWPTHDALQDAVASAVDATRRLLLPGDTAALIAVDGTDGREMPLDRKLRLLSHGILLERWEGGPVMRPHPLMHPLLHA